MRIKWWAIGLWQRFCDIWALPSRLSKVESKICTLEYMFHGLGQGLKTELEWTEWGALGIYFRGLDRDMLVSYQKAIGMWPSEKKVKRRIRAVS